MPVSAHIKIEKEQALRWSKRALRSAVFFKFAWFYAVGLIILWLIIAIADLIGGQPQLAALHALSLFLVWIGLTIYDYYRWNSSLEKTTVGWEFDATLDEEGVKTDTKVETEIEVPWSFYTGYREYDDHLEIHDKKDQVTFVPKTDELADVVTFTKEKIRSL
jgi:hypothetical protein